ncbi:hypothetical protein IID21_04820 [Patescibacteria group bacterium]|nr:hypothetical protein [Patescibacteria group bacterium]
MSEAIKSSNIVLYKEGYRITLTLRDGRAKVFPLLQKMESIVKYANKHGFKPSWNDDTNNKTDKREPASLVSLGECSKCGAKNARNPKTGKIFCTDKCWLKEQSTEEEIESSVNSSPPEPTEEDYPF